MAVAVPQSEPSAPGNTGVYDVGVVFVHGIGQQGRKDTLRDFGKALFDWVERRMRSPAIAALVGDRVPQSRTEPVPDDGVTPAYSRIEIPVDSNNGTSKWLLAEAWWGDDFKVPGMWELSLWGFRAIPWTLGSHFGTGARRSWKRLASQVDVLPLLMGAVGFVWSLALLVVAAGVALILAFVVLFLALLSVLALTRKAAFLTWVVRSVPAFLGDAYALVANPWAAGEIEGRVEAVVGWVANRCPIVAVVAHSQGGAVAHRALRSQVPGQVKVLVTFGSGLRKLEELQDAEGTSVAAGLFLLAAATWGASATLFWWGNGWALAMGLFGLACFVGAGARFIQGSDDPRLRERLTSVRQKLPGPDSWTDYFASADPVPNGPLFDEPDLVSVEVHNRGSVLWDHNAYWSNRDGFVGLVASQITRLAPLPVVKAALVLDDALVAKVLAQRQWRVRWLRDTKRLAMLAGITMIVVRWEVILVILGWLLAPTNDFRLLIETRVPQFVLALVSPFRGWVEAAVAIVLAWLPVCLVCALIDGSWRLWDRDDVNSLCKGNDDYNPGWRGRTGFALLSALVVTSSVSAAFVEEPRMASVSWATAVAGTIAISCAWAGVLAWLHRAWQRSRSKVDAQKKNKVPKVSPPAGRYP